MGMERIKVLLVEDDEDSRELLAEVLRGDFDVDTAMDGVSGLERFAAARPDVVVTDESLPGLRGTALAKAIKERDSKVGIILVSGYLKPPGAEACDVVLKKPIDVNALSSAVEVLYAREHGNPEAALSAWPGPDTA